MANFNKVLLMGNLTRDPQLSYTPNQTAVVDFGLAVNRRWTGKNGEARDETCFVDCRAFGRPAENINKYLTKGRLVFVEGRLTFDSWTSQDGTKRSKHRVTVETFQFLPAGGQGLPGAPALASQEAAGEAGEHPDLPSDAGMGAEPGAEQPAGPSNDIPF